MQLFPLGMQNRVPGPFRQYERSHRSRQITAQWIRLPSAFVDGITLPCKPSPPPFKTPHHVTAESSAPPIQDHLLPPLPHTVPLRMTPTTPTPILRVTSPVPRPRSHLFSPASPPPTARAESPAFYHSRAESPAPATLDARPLLGKTSMSSLLTPSSWPASPGPATGPGAPPLLRQTDRTTTSDVGGPARKSW